MVVDNKLSIQHLFESGSGKPAGFFLMVQKRTTSLIPNAVSLLRGSLFFHIERVPNCLIPVYQSSRAGDVNSIQKNFPLETTPIICTGGQVRKDILMHSVVMSPQILYQ